MGLQDILSKHVVQVVKAIYNQELPTVEFQATRKEFAGDITVVIFPMLRIIKGNPVQIGEEIGQYLVEHVAEVEGFNVIKGFLNIEIKAAYFIQFFNGIKTDATYGFASPDPKDKAIMVEYSSPNTNKPLHLGHIRNNLLGYSVSEILKASGKKVYKTQIINDRGIHICKSMLAWQKYGNGETPESTGLKGDKLVGNYYVEFDRVYKAQINDLIAKGADEKQAAKQAPIIQQAQEMLRKWEEGDTEVVRLWNTMNGWVYDGFNETYTNLGVDFDQLYYESNSNLLRKATVAEGLEKGVLYTKEDGSVWIDLTQEALDEKIVLRADGTAVYMTQDIGTAIQRI